MKQKAEVFWKSLHGLICIYKPPEASCDYVKHRVLYNLCNELNSMETREPENYLDIVRTSNDISINVRPSFADNVLCVGPRYQPQDFDVTFPSYLGKKASGVLRINNGKHLSKLLRKSFMPKCYSVKGILGQATNNFHIDDKVVARGKFDHVNKHLLDKLLASYQAANQSRIFMEYETDLKSQEAYELAVSGLYRPKEKKTPIIYSLKCTDFQPPYFTIEINCINEKETVLMNIIHNLGVSMKCFATCTGLRCIRQGCFTVEHALLKKHWKVEHIIDNMKLCFDILQKSTSGTIGHSPTLKQCPEL